MKKWLIVSVFAGVLLVSSGAASAAAGPLPIFNPPKHSFLALGDSLAFGFQFATFNQNFPTEPPTAFSTGYADNLARMLQGLRPDSQLINFGCPGESTVTFLQGGRPYTRQGFLLHNSYAGTQLSAAVTFLHDHLGQVSPITSTSVTTTSTRSSQSAARISRVTTSKALLCSLRLPTISTRSSPPCAGQPLRARSS